MGDFDFSSFNIRFLDFVDIFLVAIILYYVYTLIRGTIAVNILIGLGIIYAVYLLVRQFNMHLLSQIFGGFISVGALALVVVFQQEIRRFLIHIGRNIPIRRKSSFWSMFVSKKMVERDNKATIKAVVDACRNMSKSKTGALIVFAEYADEDYYQSSGEHIDAKLTRRLLESIFAKNSPLHDGAVVIVDSRIVKASCVLPVSENDHLPLRFGLRHRAAIGVTEVSEAVAVVVSEESGEVSFAKEGEVQTPLTFEQLEELLELEL